MAVLNDKTPETEKIIHLMVTPLCDRKCQDCCNNQYDMAAIPVVTTDELSRCEMVCITGGEPFAYTNPRRIAVWLKKPLQQY